MPDRPMRLTSIMGVARALLATLSVEDSVAILISEFGWDAAFQALSLLRDEPAEEAFALCWTKLVTGPIGHDLRMLGGLG